MHAALDVQGVPRLATQRHFGGHFSDRARVCTWAAAYKEVAISWFWSLPIFT